MQPSLVMDSKNHTCTSTFDNSLDHLRDYRGIDVDYLLGCSDKLNILIEHIVYFKKNIYLKGVEQII